MSKVSEKKVMDTALPFYKNNRDEHFLIDFEGIVVPDANMIFYGLLNSPYSEDFPYIRDIGIINKKELYYDLAYYDKHDMLKRLMNIQNNEEWNYKLSMEDVLIEAQVNYQYIPWDETLVWHALAESAMFDFVKSITINYSRKVTELDMVFLESILPKIIRDKLIIAEGPTLETYLENNKPYTSLITNSLDACKELILNRDKHKVKDTFFLLRNHSGNTTMKKIISVDGKIQYHFTEIGSDEILPSIVDISTDLAISPIRFARFEPVLYSDVKLPEDFHPGT